MRTSRIVLPSLLVVVAAAVTVAATTKPAAPKGEWSMNATIIEACSCPMFCSCYFGSGQPAGHHDMTTHAEEHFCRFNNAFRINKGSYKGTSLDGAKFWVGGDLGGDFSKGQMDWAVLTFDKATTQAQRDGIAAIVGKLYPVKWNSLSTGEGEMTWSAMAPNGQAVAKLDGGKTAEVRLKRFPGYSGEPITIKNLPYWGVKRHDGFVLMPNEVEAYRVGAKAFEFKGTNGFMITWDMNSQDVAAAAK